MPGDSITTDGSEKLSNSLFFSYNLSDIRSHDLQKCFTHVSTIIKITKRLTDEYSKKDRVLTLAFEYNRNSLNELLT